MKDEITKYWESINGVDPYARATLYVYCDKCGSFNIKSYIDLRQWLLIIAACGIMAVGTLAGFLSGRVDFTVIFIIISLGICMLAFKLLWGDANYKCRKCGSAPSTEYNTLDYPSNMEIVDVPDQLTQKRIMEYWPDSYDIDYMLKRPKENKTLTPTESSRVWWCQKCGAIVDPTATVCPSCGVQFEN
jgi:ribosomal protein L40E